MRWGNRVLPADHGSRAGTARATREAGANDSGFSESICPAGLGGLPLSGRWHNRPTLAEASRLRATSAGTQTTGQSSMQL